MIWVHGGRGFCPHSHLCSILYIGEILHNRALRCAEMIVIKKYYTWFHARSLPKRRNLMKMQLFCKNHPYPCVIQKELHGKLHRRGDRLCNDFQMRGILHTRVGFEPAGNACYHKPTTHQVAPDRSSLIGLIHNGCILISHWHLSAPHAGAGHHRMPTTDAFKSVKWLQAWSRHTKQPISSIQRIQIKLSGAYRAR